METASFVAPQAAHPTTAHGTAARYVVVGIGIRCAAPQRRRHEHCPPRQPAGRGAAAWTPPPPCCASCPPLVAMLQGFEACGFAPVQPRFAARDVLQGRPVTLSDGQTGTAHGVGEDGALLVHTAQGMQAVTSAESACAPPCSLPSDTPSEKALPMLRLAVIALLLANAGYYAYTQGWLRSAGLVTPRAGRAAAPAAANSPETLKGAARAGCRRQPHAAARTGCCPGGRHCRIDPCPTAAAPADAGECLQAGVLRQAGRRPAHRRRPPCPGSWSLEPTPITGRWMIYMGRFDDQDTLDKKRAELRARKVDFDRAGGTLELGPVAGPLLDRRSRRSAASRP